MGDLMTPTQWATFVCDRVPRTPGGGIDFNVFHAILTKAFEQAKNETVLSYRGVIEDISKNWDHDSDAHKYGTNCRVCICLDVLAGRDPWRWRGPNYPQTPPPDEEPPKPMCKEPPYMAHFGDRKTICVHCDIEVPGNVRCPKCGR